MQTQKTINYLKFKLTALTILLVLVVDFCITYFQFQYLKYQELNYRPNIEYLSQSQLESAKNECTKQLEDIKNQRLQLISQRKRFQNKDNFQNPNQLNSFQKELNSKNIELQSLETEIKSLKENLSFHERQDYKKQFDIPIPNPFQLPITHKESLPQKTKKPFMEILKDYENQSSFSFYVVEEFYKENFSNGYSLEDLKSVFFSVDMKFSTLRLYLIEIDYSEFVFKAFDKFYSLNDFIKSSYTENELDKLFKDKTIPQQILSKRNLLIQIENMENTKQQIIQKESQFNSLQNEIKSLQENINLESQKPLYNPHELKKLQIQSNEKAKEFDKILEHQSSLYDKKIISDKHQGNFSFVPHREKIFATDFIYVFYSQFSDFFSFHEYFQSLKPTQNPLKHFIVLYDFVKNCFFSTHGKFMGYSVGWSYYYRFFFYGLYSFLASILFFIYSTLLHIFPFIKHFYKPFIEIQQGSPKGLFNYLWDIIILIIAFFETLFEYVETSLKFIKSLLIAFTSSWKENGVWWGTALAVSVFLAQFIPYVGGAITTAKNTSEKIMDFVVALILVMWQFVISIFQGTLTVSLNSTNFFAVFFLLILKISFFFLQIFIKIIKYPFIIFLYFFFHIAEAENMPLVIIQNYPKELLK